MTPAQILPIAMIVLQVVSGVVYLWGEDWRRAVYWIAAAVLTAAVTF